MILARGRTAPLRGALLLASAIAVTASAACGGQSNTPPAPPSSAGARVDGGPDGRPIVRGGGIVASMHADPRTFNRYLSQDVASDIVATLLHAKLVRLNRVTQEIEPWLAESWTRSDDGLRYTMKLRPNVDLLGRPPVHVGRCVVFVRGGVRRTRWQR